MEIKRLGWQQSRAGCRSKTAESSRKAALRVRTAELSARQDARHLRALSLEDIEGLLQARDLLLATLLALCVRLRLGDALRLELVVVLKHRIELFRRRAEVVLRLREEGLRLLLVLVLVLHGRRLLSREHLVVLRQSLVLGLGEVLCCLAFRKHLRKVRLGNLEHSDNA